MKDVFIFIFPNHFYPIVQPELGQDWNFYIYVFPEIL